MDEHAIVKELLNRGILATPEIIARAKESDLEAALGDKTKESAATKGTFSDITCRMKAHETGSEITPDDVIKANMFKYDVLRKVLLRKADAISINNIGRTNSKICVVGMVRDNEDGGFVLEDSTGEIHVNSKDRVDHDDVIGVRGWMRDGRLFADEIMYPDIPMGREINTMKGIMLLSYEQHGPSRETDIVVTPDTLMKGSSERMLPNPAWIFLENGNKKITVFVYSVEGIVTKEMALSWLKKRYVQTRTTLPNTDMVMDAIPDIIWIVSDNEPWAGNYKGVTVLSFSRKHSVRIDLETRKFDIR